MSGTVFWGSVVAHVPLSRSALAPLLERVLNTVFAVSYLM